MGTYLFYSIGVRRIGLGNSPTGSRDRVSTHFALRLLILKFTMATPLESAHFQNAPHVSLADPPSGCL